MDQGQYTGPGLVMLDLQKDFDMVDHSVLLQKLEAFGLDTNSVSCFDSYLGNHTQIVEDSGIKYDVLDTTCRVPQGSILGLLLFLIYINDIEGAVNCGIFL